MSHRINKIHYKKLIICGLSIFLLLAPAYSAADKTSEDYLKNKRHLAVMNPIAEHIAQTAIKKALKKQAPGRYKVRFDGYTLSSMKKGVFKNLKIIGKHIKLKEIEIPYIEMKTETDYNWIDYTKDPIEILSDIILSYNMELSEKSINDTLATEEYNKVIRKVNKYLYPLFTIENVQSKIKNEKLYIIMEYNFPIKPSKKNKTITISSGVNVINHKVNLTNIGFDNMCGNLPINKIRNLVNILDPLSFTLNLMDNNNCSGYVENIKIEDDMLKINGKIDIKGKE